MDNIKKAQKLIKFGQLSKDDIVIGKDEVDEKFKTPCGPKYTEYNQCIRSNYGDVFECHNQRKKVENCEQSIGLYKYDVADLRRRIAQN